jgi:hypothetical protein
LRNPDDGVDAEGVDGEKEGGDPGAGYFEAEEDAPEEDGTEGMKEDIDGMVPVRGGAPETPLDPERGPGERVVISGLLGSPDVAESFGKLDESVAGESDVVVPGESGREGGDVDEEGEDEEGDALKAGVFPEGKGAVGIGGAGLGIFPGAGSGFRRGGGGRGGA